MREEHLMMTRPRMHMFAGAAVAAVVLVSALADDAPNYGKPGDPIKLAVGYQPYYTEAWSAVVMKAKAFWKQHLPAGSEVTFEPAPQGSVLVGKMIAGQEVIAYMGDMPAIVASSRPEVADIRIVSVLGTSQQQCNVFLV